MPPAIVLYSLIELIGPIDMGWARVEGLSSFLDDDQFLVLLNHYGEHKSSSHDNYAPWSPHFCLFLTFYFGNSMARQFKVSK